MTQSELPPGTGAPLRLEDFDYDLPEERIAQHPAAERDASRLLLLDRTSGRTEHRAFRELPEILRPGDLLVLNDARVWPARLRGRKETGGAVEALLLEALLTGYKEELWYALVRGIRVGQKAVFEEEIEGVAEEDLGKGKVLLRLRAPGRLARKREAAGEVPLPPYIRREGPPGEEDRERYQTVFARVPGAIAAPTAGLHFTDGILGAIRERGIETAWVTLLVGYGTFQPVRVEDAREHRLDAESYKIPDETVAAIEAARARGVA